MTWFKHHRGHQCRDTTHQMNGTRTRDVDDPHFVKPSMVIPDPVSRETIDQGVQQGEQNVGF